AGASSLWPVAFWHHPKRANTRSPRDVHSVDDIVVAHRGRARDVEDLLRAPRIDRDQAIVQFRRRRRFAIDAIARPGSHLENDGRKAGGDIQRWLWELHIHRVMD